MILSGPAIKAAVESGEIVIDPKPEKYGPNSVDLRLGPLLRVYKAQMAYLDYVDDLRLLTDPPPASAWAYDVSDARTAARATARKYVPDHAVLDPYKVNETIAVPIPPDGLVLLPGIFYLGATVEQAGAAALVPRLDGRSTIGRLALQIHFTAGLGDTGWAAVRPPDPAARVTWTTEMLAAVPIRVRAGDPICQVTFEEVRGPIQPYQGRYQDQRGATPAKPLPPAIG